MSVVFVELKFLMDYPALSGTDLQVYGPFKKGHVYAVPKDNARLLIKHGNAVATRKESLKPTLKQIFKGEVLDTYIEGARTKPLFPAEDKEALRKRLLREVKEVEEEAKQVREK